MSLALHIIAKDESEHLQKIVSDYGKYFDEIAIAIDFPKTLIGAKWDHNNVKVYPYDWVDDFADKRNYLSGNTLSEYYFRMDTDDTIAHPEMIREVYENAKAKNVDVVHVPYIYETDKDGNCVAKHWRETIIRKSKNHYWKKPVHENIFVEDQSKYKGVKDKRLAIVHKTEEGHAEASAERNFKILLEEFNQDKENTDPRTISYLGRMLMAAGAWEKAVFFLEHLITRSGWEDDKYFAWVQISRCKFQLGDFDVAVAACNEALAINPEFPDAYHILCEIYIAKEEYKKAVHWGAIGLSKPEPSTMTVVDPSMYGYRAIMNMAMALFAQGDYETAKKYYDKAESLAPSNEFILSNKEMFEEGYNNDKYIKNLMWMVSYAEENDSGKLRGLIESIPKNMLQDERIHSLRNRVLPPTKWHENEIAIYCGKAWEDWAAPSVLSGIGGSEEAVIYISKELTKLGHKVTVFNSCGDMAGEYEGVTYRPFHEFNPNDSFNTVIAWRGDIFNGSVRAKNKIIWLHDVPQDGQFGTDFDRVIVLSEYHKSLLPKDIPESKVFVSSNGINLPDFSPKEYPRNAKRMIYTSSYDRGIEHLLKMWPDVKKEVPDAELHLFYGWETYDRMMATGARPKDYKDYMVKLMDQDGITNHGRVGHKRLISEYMKSGLYVYPSHFEEISCISAMKAQACGCVPVVVNYAALKETVKEGVRIEGQAGKGSVNDEFKTALIDALNSDSVQDNIRRELIKVKNDFGWDKVAEQWDKEMLSDSVSRERQPQEV